MRRWSMLAALAWRESRNTRRRLLIYMSAISLGVAALVAIDSYAANIKSSVAEQSRALLGGDLSLSSRQTFPAKLDSILDSLQARGIGVARVTTFASMALARTSELTRLVQVRAISESYPLYGDVVTEPPLAWSQFRSGDGANAIVDPTVLSTLRVSVGDSIRIGLRSFLVTGVLRSVPGDPGVIAAIGPRVLIPMSFLAETQLLAFGSVAQREALLRVPEQRSAQQMLRQIRRQLDSVVVRGRTASQTEDSLTASLDELTDFLSLVGLVALLLGGIGVASGVHAHIARKVDTVAILRSLGATSGQVLAMYVAQAAAMGLVGAAIGAAAGVAVQFALPVAAQDFLPVDVRVTLEWSAILAGLVVGGWIALAFALIPLLGIRRISPLQALRRTTEGSTLGNRLTDPVRLAVLAVLVASLTTVAVARTGTFMRGAGMSAGVLGVILLLSIVSWALARGARRVLRRGWPYVVRQGIANLYRPGNQTRSVILALGFGAFLISTLYLVQVNLLSRFDAISTSSRGNLLLFDIQEDQATGVDSLLRLAGAETLELTPIVTMRIAMLNGTPVRELMERRSRSGGGGALGGSSGTWALRREYRSSYVDSLDDSEKIVAGTQFGRRKLPDAIAEVSFERDVAAELNIALGDTVVWDVQGAHVKTIVTSLREVNWGKLETNFFAVFGPGSIQSAPKQFALLCKVPDPVLGTVQGRIVDRYANVAAIDLTLVAQTIAGIQSKASVAIRFTALFSLAMGIPVLIGAVAATRRERIREGVLLRTLGATRVQIQQIMVSEYAILGALGTLTGVLLGIAGAWAVTWYLFDQRFVPVAPELLVLALLMILITTLIGFVSGRDVYRATPAEALREV